MSLLLGWVGAVGAEDELYEMDAGEEADGEGEGEEERRRSSKKRKYDF